MNTASAVAWRSLMERAKAVGRSSAWFIGRSQLGGGAILEGGSASAKGKNARFYVVGCRRARKTPNKKAASQRLFYCALAIATINAGAP
jgi:hypothetical protein